MDCGVPLVLVPWMGVTSTTVLEIERHVAPHGELGAMRYMGLRVAAMEPPRNRFLRRSSSSRFHRFHGIVSAMAAHSSVTTNTTGWFTKSCMAH